jgi:hypothetical protein
MVHNPSPETRRRMIVIMRHYKIHTISDLFAKLVDLEFDRVQDEKVKMVTNYVE